MAATKVHVTSDQAHALLRYAYSDRMTELAKAANRHLLDRLEKGTDIYVSLVDGTATLRYSYKTDDYLLFYLDYGRTVELIDKITEKKEEEKPMTFIELTKAQAKEIVKRAFSGNSEQYDSTMSTINGFGYVEGDDKRKIVVCGEFQSVLTLLFLGYTNECGIFFKWCDLFRIQATQYLKEIESVKNDDHIKEYISKDEAIELFDKSGVFLTNREKRGTLDRIGKLAYAAKFYVEHFAPQDTMKLNEAIDYGRVELHNTLANLKYPAGMDYLKEILDKRCSKEEKAPEPVKTSTIPTYGLRKCRVNGQDGYLFHRWVENLKPVSKYPMMKTPTEFIESRYPMAIVEGPDGQVSEVSPENVKFDKDVQVSAKVGCNGKAFAECIKRVKYAMEEEAAKYDEAMEKVKALVQPTTYGTRADFCGIDEPTPKAFNKVVYKGLSSDKAKSWWNAMLNARDTDIPVILNAKSTRIIDATLMSKSLGDGFVDYEVCVQAIYRN